jgi:hypothetical protein
MGPRSEVRRMVANGQEAAFHGHGLPPESCPSNCNMTQSGERGAEEGCLVRLDVDVGPEKILRVVL